MIGQTISHYKILAKIGEDASGELYQATDTEANRSVRLKILADNPAILARLEQVSRLEHPSIARIEEISRSGDIHFAVLEAPAGGSVYDLLQHERPHRRHLLRYAAQIAGALAAAHREGMAHGPLNPAAIFISPQRNVKIHDFGFTVLDPPPDSEEGRQALLGPAAPYISPEQIQGSRPDIRSDIFSFGALLFHLTTGRPAFTGPTVAATWKAILEDEPKPISQITSRVPAGMDKLLERCLRKSPQRRFQQMDEIEPLLEKMIAAHRDNPQHQASYLSRNRGRLWKIAGITLAAAGILAAGVFWWKSAAAREPLLGSRIRQVTSGPGFDTDPVLSADGNLLAYASDRKDDGNLDIWVQPFEGGNPRQLTSDPADDREPAFSPDGATIAFRSDRNGGGVYLIPSQGGEARLIAPDGRRPRFSPDGRWIVYWVAPAGFAPKSDGAYKLFIIPAAGGKPRQIRPDFASCSNPIWSPDSKSVLFAGRPDSVRSDAEGTDWFVASVEGERVINTTAFQLFHREGILPESQYGVPGDWRGSHIYFSSPAMEGSSVWRADIAPETQKISTRPLKVTSGPGIDMLPYAATGGRLVFARQTLNPDIWGIPVSANEGKVTGAPKRWTHDPAIDVSPALSADGSRLIFQSNRTGHYNIWQLDTASGKESPVAASAEDQYYPMLSPDGSKVAWSETRIGRYEQFYKSVEGGATEVLCETCGPAVSGWSKDGRSTLIDSFLANHRLAVSLVKVGNPAKSLVLQDSGSDLRQARFSPDERWIVFVARLDGGSSRIYVAPFGDRGAPSSAWVALTDGNAWVSSPQWSPDGKLVYYVSSRDGYRCIWAQPLDAAGRPSGSPFAVFHFHSARRPLTILPFDDTDLYVARDQLLVSVSVQAGNIWSARVAE